MSKKLSERYFESAEKASLGRNIEQEECDMIRKDIEVMFQRLENLLDSVPDMLDRVAMLERFQIKVESQLQNILNEYKDRNDDFKDRLDSIDRKLEVDILPIAVFGGKAKGAFQKAVNYCAVLGVIAVLAIVGMAARMDAATMSSIFKLVGIK